MNRLELEARVLREALAQVAEVGGSGHGCPDAAELWDSAVERLPRRRNEAIIRHIGGCTACAIAWDLARDLSPAAERTAPAFGWRQLAAAAVVLLAVTGGALWITLDVESPTPTAYRDLAAGWLVTEIAEGETLPRDALLLRWSTGPQGTTYDVHVTDDSLRPLASARGLLTPELAIDPERLAEVEPGGRILWRVTARLPDGDSVTSMTFIHTVE